MIALAEASTASAPVRSESQILSHLQQTVSASRLSCFLQCRLKFWFRYVAKLKKAKTPALHLGGSVHQVLKAWNMARWKSEPLSLTKLYGVFEAAWSDQKDESVDWREHPEAEQKATGWRLVETYIRESKIPPELRPEAVEVPVEADLHQHGLPTLIGVLDLVQAGVIIDYKTSSTAPNPERAAHNNEAQMSCYALLYREAKGKRESGIEIHTLVKTKTPKLVVTASAPITAAQQSRLFRLIESYTKGLDRQDFVPSPGMQCMSCEFFNECRAWH